MRSRWFTSLESQLPSCDLEDLKAVLDDPQASRQFAPEYSQVSYLDMLAKDEAIGDYIKINYV